MASRSVTFKAYHGEKGEILQNDDTGLELAGFSWVTEFVLPHPEKMDLVTAKSLFMRNLHPPPPPPPSCGDIAITALFSLSCTDIEWRQWDIKTTADWRNWIRGCVDRGMPPVAVVDAIVAAKAPSNPHPPPQAPKAAASSTTTALEVAAYTQAEQHAREIIARVDGQMSLLAVGASMSQDEHYNAWSNVRAAAKKMLPCLRRGSSPDNAQPPPQANYRVLPPSFVPAYQPPRPPQTQANTYLGLGLPPGCNLPHKTHQPAPTPAPAPANQVAPGLQHDMALDSASSTSASSSPVQRGTPAELRRPQKHKAAAASRKKPPTTATATAAVTPPVTATGRGQQPAMLPPHWMTPSWFPSPALPASKRAKPNPTTTTSTPPTVVGAAAGAKETASPAPATAGGGGI